MLKRLKEIKWGKIFSTSVLISFILPIAFLIYKIITTTNEIDINNTDRTRSDYVLMLIQCLLGIVAMVLPEKASQKFKIQIPNNMYYLYVLFLYAAIFLGEIRNFYYTVPYWDAVLHTFSGAMIGCIGFSIISLLNDREFFHLNLTPFFIAFFAFCFAIMLGTVWEIYEYTSDNVLKTNMQKYRLESGENLEGRDALKDTMEDLVVDGIGAFATSTVGYLLLKNDQKGWIKSILIHKKKDKKGEEDKA